MVASVQLTRIRLQKGRHLVKRGEIWYLETCSRARQRRRSLGTSDLEEATRLVATTPITAPEGGHPRIEAGSRHAAISKVDLLPGGRRVSRLARAALHPSKFLVMVAIGRGRAHGYRIMREIQQLSGGAVRMGPGTLYRCLQLMLAEGLIEEVSGTGRKVDPRRRHYRLSKDGLSSAQQESLRLESMIHMARARGLAFG